MIKFLCYIFNIPYPKINVGDVFIHDSDVGDPFSGVLKYEVIEIKNGWVSLDYAHGNRTSRRLRDFRASYTKI